ncbi:MFS transporter [Pinirhizobacter sp.]|jgi:MFS family permease|uniref:MFS transporter n=1 Tax=Pinirhizobacter sp. TaxID=2950432 RepID=UPI002F3FF97F
MSAPPDHALASLSVPTYRRLWLATVAAHTGYWAQAVAVAWWLVEQKCGPQVVALAHFSSSLPVLLLSYASGWLIDRFDYLQVQRLSQGWILVTSVAMIILMCLDSTSPYTLLLLTSLMGAGVALRNPAWQASIGQIVSLRHLSSATVLSSVGFNLARTLGPLIAGLLISAWGVWSALFYNAITAFVLFITLQWPPAYQPAAAPRTAAIVAPISPNARRWLGRLCLRAIGIGLPTSALLVLLPVVASSEERGPTMYAWLLGAFGGGGFVAALIRPRLVKALGPDRLLNIFSGVFAACLLLVAWQPQGHLLGSVAAAGAAWLILFSTLNVAVHSHSAASCRGRALAAYMTSAFGGMAAGGLLWGWLAEEFDCNTALAMGAAALLCGLACYRPRVCQGTEG